MESQTNPWQRTAELTHGVLTPANIIDVAAMKLAWDGTQQLDSWQGIITAGMGFAADVLDGRVARATNTDSPLGEMVDASGDKIKMAFTLPRLWQMDKSPKMLLSAIAIQNGINATLTVADQANSQLTGEDQKIHPSSSGKKAVFMQCSGVGLWVLGNKIEEYMPEAGRTIKLGGKVLGWAGVGLGAKATWGYINDFKKS